MVLTRFSCIPAATVLVTGNQDCICITKVVVSADFEKHDVPTLLNDEVNSRKVVLR